MVQLWRAFGSIVPMFLMIAFIMTVVAHFIYCYKRSNVKIIFVNTLLVLSVVAILLVTLGTGMDGRDIPRIVNVVPILETYEMIVSSTYPVILIRNLFLNVLLFMPFGFLMKARMSHKKKITLKITLIGLLLSLFVEIAQYVLPMNRWADIDDVFLNTFGTFLGCVLWSKLFSRNSSFPKSYNTEKQTRSYRAS